MNGILKILISKELIKKINLTSSGDTEMSGAAARVERGPSPFSHKPSMDRCHLDGPEGHDNIFGFFLILST